MSSADGSSLQRIVSGAFARELIARRSARVQFEHRHGGADGPQHSVPGVEVDLGMIGTVNFATRDVVGRGSLHGRDSVYHRGTLYERGRAPERFIGHGGPEPEPLPLGNPLWLLFALTAGAHEVSSLGSTTLRETPVERFALALSRERIRSIAAEQGIDGLEHLRSQQDVPAEVWAGAHAEVVRLAYTDPPLKAQRSPQQAAETLWHCTDLWDFGVTPLDLPLELRADPPDADHYPLPPDT